MKYFIIQLYLIFAYCLWIHLIFVLTIQASTARYRDPDPPEAPLQAAPFGQGPGEIGPCPSPRKLPAENSTLGNDVLQKWRQQRHFWTKKAEEVRHYQNRLTRTYVLKREIFEWNKRELSNNRKTHKSIKLTGKDQCIVKCRILQYCNYCTFKLYNTRLKTGLVT